MECFAYWTNKVTMKTWKIKLYITEKQEMSKSNILAKKSKEGPLPYSKTSANQKATDQVPFEDEKMDTDTE
jgi:hypothetical protein